MLEAVQQLGNGAATMGWVWQALLPPNLLRAALNCCCDCCLAVPFTENIVIAAI